MELTVWYLSPIMDSLIQEVRKVNLENITYSPFQPQTFPSFTHNNHTLHVFLWGVEELKQFRKQYPHFKIRIGCEVKILEDGTLNTTKDILDAAEVVIGSVHWQGLFAIGLILFVVTFVINFIADLLIRRHRV